MDGVFLAAAIALLLLFLLTLFQAALIIGLPLGRFAWGGKHQVLPRNLRIGSGVSIVLYGIFALFIASKAAIISSVFDEKIISIGMWVISVYFCIGIIMNLVSRSKSERLLMTPVAAALALMFFAVTLFG